MKKLFIYFSALALVLTACQKNENFDNGIKQTDGRIKFGVITPKTRAADLYQGTNTFLTDGQTFNVVGLLSNGDSYLGAKSPLIPVKVTYNKANNEWTYPGLTFWPNESLDFFAWKDGDNGTATPSFTYQNSANSMAFADYTVQAAVEDQNDLLVTADQFAKPTLTQQTVLTFKHALTQVVFSAQLYTDLLTPTPGISVRIDEVEIVNVASQGDLKVSKFGYTANNVGDKNEATDRTVEDKIVWSDQATPSSFGVIGLNNNNGIDVGNNVTSLTNNTKGAMLMIPQTFAAWDVANKIENETTNAYIRVKAYITDLKSGKVLWGEAGTASKDLYIPVSSVAGVYGEWVWGRKINYVIVFGDPNSGSGGGGWGGDGDDPILVPIRLEAQLTDWDEYSVYLQTANFSGTAANVQGLVDQFITEVNNNPAKKYTANFTVTGTANGTISWSGLTSADKFKEGSKITINLSNATNITPSAPAAPAGYEWIETSAGNVYVYILTASPNY